MKLGAAAAAFCSVATTANALSFDFVSRHYFPAGYKDGTTEGKPDQ